MVRAGIGSDSDTLKNLRIDSIITGSLCSLRTAARTWMINKQTHFDEENKFWKLVSRNLIRYTYNTLIHSFKSHSTLFVSLFSY